MNEYRVKVTVRNNLLLSAMESAGYKSQKEFAAACGIHVTSVNSLVGLREPPINSDGEFTSRAKAIMEVLGACPTDLWTEKQLTMTLRRSTGEFSLSESAIQEFLDTHIESMTLPDPSSAMEEKQDKEVIQRALCSVLTENELKVLSLRYGIRTNDSRCVNEVAKIMEFSPERVKFLEKKAIFKLRKKFRIFDDMYS